MKWVAFVQGSQNEVIDVGEFSDYEKAFLKAVSSRDSMSNSFYYSACVRRSDIPKPDKRPFEYKFNCKRRHDD